MIVLLLYYLLAPSRTWIKLVPLSLVTAYHRLCRLWIFSKFLY